MTIATGQLNAAAAQKQTARDEANEATIRQNMPRVLEMLQERIAELEAANAALLEVALAADDADVYPSGDYEIAKWSRLLIALDNARYAGYLEVTE